MSELDLGPDLRTPECSDDSAVLRHALSLKPDGWALEFGVGGGGSLSLIAERMPVIGFDSFSGLPEDWRPGFEAGAFAQAKIPQVENATIVVGLFDDTLPAFDWPERVGLVHLDADLYSSTVTALCYAGHLLQPGTVVAFDEYHSYDGSEDHEARAWEEWTLEHLCIWTPIGHGREQFALRILGFGEHVA